MLQRGHAVFGLPTPRRDEFGAAGGGHRSRDVGARSRPHTMPDIPGVLLDVLLRL